MSSKDRILFLLTIIVALGLFSGYALSSKAVTVTVDGAQTTVHTHRTAVGDLLAELGIILSADDLIDPPPSAPVLAGSVIRITRAHSVVLHVDGVSNELRTHAQTPAAVLREAGVQVQARDQVFLDGQLVDINAPFQPRSTKGAGGASLASLARASLGVQTKNQSSTAAAQNASPLVISLRRAVSVSISQDGASASIMTAASVVGEALFGEGIYIYAADRVSPSLDEPVAAGMHISIQRARPVTVTADGRTFSTRTQATTVAAMLAEEGIVPQGKDYSTPTLQSAVAASIVVQLTRVREETITESEGIAFTTVTQLDGNLDLDQRRIVTSGKQGVRKRTIRVVFENGKEVQRVVDREWVDEAPTTQVIAYGANVVVRTMMTADGPIEYWRELRVWATFYTPLTSGTALDAPYFGITRTGLRATKGLIAVDPRVISLHTGMYVPGYGRGAAEDTGNLVQGMVIDLCYDDDNSHPERWGWARWATIYLLAPVPGDIAYVLPDYPRERK